MVCVWWFISQRVGLIKSWATTSLPGCHKQCGSCCPLMIHGIILENNVRLFQIWTRKKDYQLVFLLYSILNCVHSDIRQRKLEKTISGRQRPGTIILLSTFIIYISFFICGYSLTDSESGCCSLSLSLCVWASSDFGTGLIIFHSILNQSDRHQAPLV